jgi:preprotein translocase subunit SecG
MVVIAVVVAAVIGVLVYRQVKKPSGMSGSSSAAASFAFVPKRVGGPPTLQNDAIEN